ncbi:hypothetical protein M0Q50_03400 [bacterium]|jgi:hypothetical protein|nr:hypothetical protein [bacterium]
MKVGDYLSCKKNYIDLRKGKYYEIMYIDENHINIYSDEYQHYYTFTLDIPIHNYAWKYFYKEKELRKMKLNSL